MACGSERESVGTHVSGLCPASEVCGCFLAGWFFF